MEVLWALLLLGGSLHLVRLAVIRKQFGILV